ncbi:gastric triacylglycerol lipase-like, partial [Asbolus verrucosus]
MTRTPQLIKQNAYNFESHTVTTPDGYILTLFRIPPEENDYRKNKQPVFLQHGTFVDSANWADIGNRSLAFNLADQGYDVWLGNFRGTRYSRRHKTLQPSDFKFWTFNLDDVAVNDIRTSLAAVARITGKRGSTIFIGHSLATIFIFMYASEYPEEAENLLKGAVAISPIVYLDLAYYIIPLAKSLPLITYDLNLFLKFQFQKILLAIKISSVFYHMEGIIKFLQYFCTLAPHVCKILTDVIYGKSYQFLPEDLLAFFSYFPTTTSLMVADHVAQLYNSGRFQKFDYGEDVNLKKYNKKKPPVYKLRKVKFPSVKRLFDELGSREKDMKVIPKDSIKAEDQFNHMDFLLAKDLHEFFYVDLFKDLTEKFA